jgi:hypothetical protein
LAALGALASTGSAVVGARNLLSIQANQARGVIPKIRDAPPRADGVYTRGGGPVERWYRGVPFDLHLMIFGDSTATGFGCRTADEVPGVLIARGLAEETGKRIRLSTKAIVGATSKGLSGQVDAMFVAGPPPDAAVIMIGANDITTLNGVGPSARRLGAAVGCPQPRVAPGARPGRRSARRGRRSGAAGRSARAGVSALAGAAVLRGQLPPLRGRIRVGGQAVTAGAV